MIKFFYNEAGDVCGFSKEDLKILGDNIKSYKALTAEQIQDHCNPTRSIAQLESECRSKRDTLLSETDWVVIRHRDEVEEVISTSLSPEEYSSMLSYRRDLRDITKQPGFPKSINWPAKPSF